MREEGRGMGRGEEEERAYRQEEVACKVGGENRR